MVVNPQMIYYVLITVVLVSGLVTGFWKWYYNNRFLGEKDVEGIVKEKSLSKLNGTTMKNDLIYLKRQVDRIITSQEVLDRKVSKFEKEIMERMERLQIEVVRINTEHDNLKAFIQGGKLI